MMKSVKQLNFALNKKKVIIKDKDFGNFTQEDINRLVIKIAKKLDILKK